LHNGGGIIARKGVSIEVYLLQAAKLLNRSEKSEYRNQNLGIRPSLISAPVTQ